MPANDYQFFTEWRVSAPRELLYEILKVRFDQQPYAAGPISRTALTVWRQHQMKNLKTIFLGLSLLAALSVSALAQQKSLYDRLGGQAAVSAVVDEFAGIVLKDERINKKFARSDANRLVTNLKAFVCSATGGPCKYEGRDMPSSHKNMGVTEGEFNALVEDLVKALDKFNVPAAEKNELLGALGPLKGQIVESNSAATGTELPKKFDPAPPLGSKKALKESKKASKNEGKKKDKGM
jgi:hemoglobin